jgi:hypothetical protein
MAGPNHTLHLTGGAVRGFRGIKFSGAPPAGEVSRSAER